MLFAVTEWIEVTTGEGWIGDLFVSGYSQGGHAAAALQKELEDNWSLVYPVTASTPMSGPYSLSGVMYDRIIGDEEYFTPAYIAYIVLSYQEAYGNLYNDLNDIFKPAYVPIIENFRDHTITTVLMNILLSVEIFKEIGVSRPKVMFRDSVLQAIIADENHPLRVALRDNDLFDWTPQAPTRLYYCTEDEQVPYRNSIVADSVMRANGAPDVAAVNFGPLSHGGCAPPAIEASIAFFDSFIFSSGIAQDPTPINQICVRTNPSRGTLELEFLSDDLTELVLSDVAGRVLWQRSVRGQSTFDVSSLSTGLYLVYIRRGVEECMQKVMVTN
jgi:hypothetical protein